MTDAAVTVIARASGLTAITLLLATLAVTPLGELLARRLPEPARSYPRWRRRLGITTACAALLHAAFSLATWVRGPLTLLLEWPFLRAGAAALLVLCLLLLTSFPTLVRALGLRAWKELHRLAYVAAFFALLHLTLAPFGARGVLLAALAAAGALVVLRVLAWIAGARKR